MSRSPNWGFSAFSAVLLWTKKYTIYLCMFIYTYAHDTYMMYAKMVPYKKVFIIKKYT